MRWVFGIWVLIAAAIVILQCALADVLSADLSPNAQATKAGYTTIATLLLPPRDKPEILLVSIEAPRGPFSIFDDLQGYDYLVVQKDASGNTTFPGGRFVPAILTPTPNVFARQAVSDAITLPPFPVLTTLELQVATWSGSAAAGVAGVPFLPTAFAVIR